MYVNAKYVVMRFIVVIVTDNGRQFCSLRATWGCNVWKLLH